MVRFLVLAVAAAGVFATAVLADGAQAGKASVSLSFDLYHLSNDDHVVEYTVQKKGGGDMDLAVSHECVLDGQVVQDRTNRLYWSGKGGKIGQWSTSVLAGSECTAVVVDLSQPIAAQGASGSGYAAVSESVTYVVE